MITGCKHFVAAAGFTFMLGFSTAHAGEFMAICYGPIEEVPPCATMINDIVTDQFTQKYPVSKYQIVIIFDRMTFGNLGTTVTHAIAGVAPVAAGKQGIVPIGRHNSWNIDTAHPNWARQKAMMQSSVRSAVTNLVSDVTNDATLKHTVGTPSRQLEPVVSHAPQMTAQQKKRIECDRQAMRQVDNGPSGAPGLVPPMGCW